MKFLITLILLASNLIAIAQQLEISEVRNLYFKINNDDCNALKLVQQFEKEPPKSALLGCYHGAALAASPECISNPMKKLSSFKKGRQLIDLSVKKEPSNTEIRFLRFATQSKAPGFLGYNDNLEEDKNYLIKNIQTVSAIKNQEIIKIITGFLIDSDLTDQNEDKIVKDFLKTIQNN